ncbi:MAG: hypothetical protein ACTJHL_13140 [Neisseriaceae bacterium]
MQMIQFGGHAALCTTLQAVSKPWFAVFILKIFFNDYDAYR